jgi:hypothetical protein
METAVFSSAAGATTASADFTYGDLSVRVSATRPDALQWLDEFLSPSFGVAPSAEYAATVTLHEDNRRYDEIAAAWRADQAVELDCFVNDSHVVRFPAVVSSNAVTAFQDSVPVFYRADPATRAFAIFSGEGRTGARTALMRVVRELAMNHSLLRGDIFLHAAALASAGRVMLIGGEKRAGKTTLLLYLLRHGGADYVSNDRVLLAARATPCLRGMPTIVSLRAQTLALLPTLAADLAGRCYVHHRTVAEAAAQKRPAWAAGDGKYSLSPAQLCALLGVRSVASGTPRVMLFPRITGEPNTGSLHDLAPAEALASLQRAVLSAGMGKKTSDFVALPGDPPAPAEEQLDAALRAFAAAVRCIECRLGTRSYESGSLAAQCFALLGDRM